MRIHRAIAGSLLLMVTFGLARASAPARITAGVVRAAGGGDASAQQGIESRLDGLFARKDLIALDPARARSEVAHLLAVEGPAPEIGWWPLEDPQGSMRLLTVDFSAAAAGSAESSRGYVAYAVAALSSPPGEAGAPASVHWYHDTGRKMEEQGGSAWHPVGATLLGAPSGAGAGPSIAIMEAVHPGAAPCGLLLLERQNRQWVAARRIAAVAGRSDARLIGVGPEGAVFLAGGEPSRGVLSGAPREIFRALFYFERRAGSFADQPATAVLPDVVTAAEALIAAVKRGDKPGAAKLCKSPDVLEAMLYFSPEWKGGGRILAADAGRVEFVYEERGRPTLRIEFRFESSAGSLLLSSVTGRDEKI